MILNPEPDQRLRYKVKMFAFAMLTVTAATGAGWALAQSHLDQIEREEWISNASRGYQDAKEFCANRQVFGLETEMPPLVKFHLNRDGAFEETFSAWTPVHDGDRVKYRLEVQFEDFDDETLTRIAELDRQVDDGDLFEGDFQLTLCGFTCELPGPVSTAEKFAGDFQGDSAVNPI